MSTISFLGTPTGATETKVPAAASTSTTETKKPEVKAPTKPVYEVIGSEARLRKPVYDFKSVEGGSWTPPISSFDFSNGAAFTNEGMRVEAIHANDAKSARMDAFFQAMAGQKPGTTIDLPQMRTSFAPLPTAGTATAGRSASPTRRGPDVSRLSQRATGAGDSKRS